MKFDQDLCLNLQYDFGKMNSTLGSVVPLAMFELELKSWKGGKRREKAEKADLVMQLAFWQTCQNAIKCHEMISVHPMLNM